MPAAGAPAPVPVPAPVVRVGPGAAEGRGSEASDHARTRAQLLENVARSWRRPDPYQKGRYEPESGGARPLMKKLNEIVLPEISFTRIKIGQVVAALSEVSREFDPADAGRKGVNIVLIDPDHGAPVVTLALRDAPLKRVLDFVTESIGYQYEVQADAVVVRPGGETTVRDTAFFPVTRATVLRMTGLGGGTGEDGGESGAIKAFLEQAGVAFGDEASLAYDGSALIVTQTPRNLERVRNILRRYRDVRQVEIEAKFMEVQEGALDELGVNWHVATKASQRNAGTQADYATDNRSLAGAFASSVASHQGSITRPETSAVDSAGQVSVQGALNIPIVNSAAQLPGAADLASAAGPLATIAGVLGEFDVNAVVRALAQKQGTDLLSAPKVTVLSGNPAKITVAQEMRYPQSYGQTQAQVGTGSASGGGSAGVAITAGTPQEFTARNVGVELRVTPTVEEDDHSISLDLNPRVTEFDGFVEYGGPSIAISGNTTVTVPSGFYQPIFSVRDISTKVTIWDGATLVMGGLTREEVKTVNDKVPILGDIPLLGRFFRSKGESAQKRNLLIFVTANLVNPGGAPRRRTTEPQSANAGFHRSVAGAAQAADANLQ
jgi:general secretion pathway protein D